MAPPIGSDGLGINVETGANEEEIMYMPEKSPKLSHVLSSPKSSTSFDQQDNMASIEKRRETEEQHDSADDERDQPCCEPTQTVADTDTQASGWSCLGSFFWETPEETSSSSKGNLDEHTTVGVVADWESLPSVSTIGRHVFGDLVSLPSVTESTVPLHKRAGHLDDVSTIASDPCGDVDVPSSETNDSKAESKKMPQQSRTEKAEKLTVVDKKLNQLDSVMSQELEKSIGNTRLNPIKMTETSSFGRTSSFGKKLHKIQKESEKAVEDDTSIKRTKSGSETFAGVKVRRQKMVRELRKAFDEHGRYDLKCAGITASLGDMYDRTNETTNAIKLHKEAVSIYSAKLGDHDPTTLEAKIRLGKMMEKNGDLDQALDLYYNVLIMRRAIKGENDSSIPDCLTFLARALKKKLQYPQAIKELKRALKLYREALGDTHPRVTATVDEISTLYIAVGDHLKAAAILEEVVKLKAATSGQQSMPVVATLHELASAYEQAGNYSKAVKPLKKAYAACTQLKGEDSEEATNALEKIARNYKAQKDKERTAAAYLGVLRGRKASVGLSHPRVADAYFQLGMALSDTGQADKAIKCMKQALAIYVGEGKNMRDVGMIANVMREMALIHKKKGQLGDALKMLKQELTIRNKMGDQHQCEKAKTYYHLGNVEQSQRNTVKALNYLMESLSIYEKLKDSSSMDFANTLYSTGQVFDSSRHPERAKEAYVEARKLFQKHDVPDSDPKMVLINKRCKELQSDKVKVTPVNVKNSTKEQVVC
eukprot:CAMPEP_0194027342 /NCGR_PEP_ID=MMETSP0009_2-20130614/1503_1 /TAXON_ID=210454 /ORGANISM="Grammatophora oceanica, Strain CCMP 410" /LENGTH=765 /DNA_ID=CAMNT_0038666377 /DNA_START=7 /DNA_END=2304 /DNA_ORIENTATION=-